MKKCSLLTALLVPLTGSLVFAGDTPTVTVVGDGQSFTIPGQWQTDGTWEFNGTAENSGPDGFQVTINGLMDPDPMIAYGIAVTDFGAPSVFGFFFSTPIVPTGSPNIVRASIVGGLTDFTGNGVSIVPTLPDIDGDAIPEVQVAGLTAPGTNMGVDVGLAVSAPPGAPGALTNYGAFAAGWQPGPAGLWTGMTIDTRFAMSGGGDIFSATGFAQIEVPEPGSVSLLAIAGSALVARRRR